MEDELKALREELAAVRRELELLRQGGTLHHYHHHAQPAPFVAPQPVYPGPVYPQWPYSPPAWCGGSVEGRAIGTGDFWSSAAS